MFSKLIPCKAEDLDRNPDSVKCQEDHCSCLLLTPSLNHKLDSTKPKASISVRWHAFERNFQVFCELNTLHQTSVRSTVSVARSPLRYPTLKFFQALGFSMEHGLNYTHVRGDRHASLF